jgi:hypothetical protein
MGTTDFSNAPGELYALARTFTDAAADFTRAANAMDTDIACVRSGGWPTLVDHWLPARDRVRDILATVSDNLTRTAQALDATAASYEQADHEAAQNFQRLNPPG